MNQTLNDSDDVQNKSSKGILKSIGRILYGVILGLLLIATFLLFLGLTFHLIDSFRPFYLQLVADDTVHLFIKWLSLIIVIYLESIVIYLIILRKLKNFSKLKKYIRNILIIILPFLLIASWGVFTMAGIIPNWLGIEKLGNICSDCKGGIIRHGPRLNPVEIPEIDGKVCCPGTYEYKTVHNSEIEPKVEPLFIYKINNFD